MVKFNLISISLLFACVRSEQISIEASGTNIRLWGHPLLNSTLSSGQNFSLENNSSLTVELKNSEEVSILTVESGSFYVEQIGDRCPLLIAYIVSSEDPGEWTPDANDSRSRTVLNMNALELMLQTTNRIFLSNVENKLLKVSCLSLDEKVYSVNVTATSDFNSFCGEYECGKTCPGNSFGVDCSGVLVSFSDDVPTTHMPLVGGDRFNLLYSGEPRYLQVEAGSGQVTTNTFNFLYETFEPGKFIDGITGSDYKISIQKTNMIQIINQNSTTNEVVFSLVDESGSGLSWLVGVAIAIVGAGLFVFIIILIWRFCIKKAEEHRHAVRTRKLPYDQSLYTIYMKCCSCEVEFDDGEMVMHIEPCGHMFHPYCFSESIPSHQKCPECQKKEREEFEGLRNYETLPISNALHLSGQDVIANFDELKGNSAQF